MKHDDNGLNYFIGMLTYWNTGVKNVFNVRVSGKNYKIPKRLLLVSYSYWEKIHLSIHV